MSAEIPEKKKSFLGKLFTGDKQAADGSSDAAQTSAADNQETTEGSQPEPRKSWFSKLTDGLRKSSSNLTGGITDLFTKRKLDDETLEGLEDLLIQADIGVPTAARITEALAKDRYDKQISPEEVQGVLINEISKVLEPLARPLSIHAENRPHVILVVGVNGTGKTTTIGKLAHRFRMQGKSVMLAAGDTFRAAAIDQLRVWAERTGSSIVAKDVGADAASLAYEAMEKAQSENADIVMIDTAGRLQNKTNLMEELEKIVRVIRKKDETAPHDVLLSLDATTGQNALRQVEAFEKTAGVTGLVMTKLDGTARGGILVAIAEAHDLPIHAIGVGEGIEDLQPFEANQFATALVDPEQGSGSEAIK